MTEGKVRIAFVGCGGHANHSLYPVIHRINEMDLVAVVDRIEGKRLRVQRKFGALSAYAEVDEMLDKEQPGGVCVVGPPQMQYEVGMQILDRGIPLFVEKPSAIDFDHAYRLAEAARNAGTFGMTAFMKRFATAYEEAKAITNTPEFGPVSMVSVRYTHGKYPLIWGLEPEPLCCLVGNQCHAFDLARFFGGDVAEVYAKLCDHGEGRFAFAVTLGFQNGAAIRQEAVDDVALERRIKAEGLKWRMINGGKHIRCRMYHSFREGYRGFTKNLFAGFGHRIPKFVLVWLWLGIAFLEPIIVLTIGLTGLVSLSSLSIALAAAAVFTSLLIWGASHWCFGFPLYLTLLYPVSIIVALAIAAGSMFFALTGRADWRGRVFARSEVKWW